MDAAGSVLIRQAPFGRRQTRRNRAGRDTRRAHGADRRRRVHSVAWLDDQAKRNRPKYPAGSWPEGEGRDRYILGRIYVGAYDAEEAGVVFPFVDDMTARGSQQKQNHKVRYRQRVQFPRRRLPIRRENYCILLTRIQKSWSPRIWFLRCVDYVLMPPCDLLRLVSERRRADRILLWRTHDDIGKRSTTVASTHDNLLKRVGVEEAGILNEDCQIRGKRPH